VKTTHFNNLDSLVLAVLTFDDMRSNGGARLEVKADRTLTTVAEDLREEAGWPSIGEIG
jgi:hypothetical protein